MSIEVDVAIIGGGVVGLACARVLAPGRRLVLFEQRRLGEGISSRNSGVVHAGLHGPPQSLKRQLAIAGNAAVWAYCATRDIPHRRSGKLVVAANAAEREALARLHAVGEACGVPGLSRWSAATLAEREPALRGVEALHSESSGTIDAAAFVAALARDAREAGAILQTGHHISWLSAGPGGFRLHADYAGSERDEIRATKVVNAAGFGAPRLARGLVETDPSVTPWKGHYFVVAPRLARTVACDLVYPMPVVAGLGTHLTRGPSGETWLGPDAVRAERANDLDVPKSLAEAFAEDARRYLPALREEHLRPAFAGMRPKLAADGAFEDFRIEESPAGCVHLLGIESPGLTAALPLADRVAHRLR